ncbi:MAG TPA: tetratricopeptide repeat protein [Herpetosiphon sp.]|uniref:TPR repeat-containing protein n=1 Tax=Herpetosiphon aurantiacus (strain ATCC 23779 / DSM 785 / 114-95) TaxID=316274 RepID=A9B0S3_HERA2|nr:tetratricopeptide repeat protein [Herpetosiphon sp.]ABX03793.1 TPR repeat-containing protein [Herpetosiphon aurantiacus DSM 785]HBW49027.1 tetratricopeptide repeat protein [Herpetosiphon sp.]
MQTEHSDLLPRYTTALIGRDAETAEIGALLAQGQRLISLVGASGAGKTRLAVDCARLYADQFVGGCFFVSLVPIRAAGLVLATIAESLGIAPTSDQPLLTTIAAHFPHQPSLLILDNIDHVVEAASDVQALVTAVPQLTILVTSQVALNVAAETIYRVPLLSVPAEDARLSASEILQYGAVQLFSERLRRLQPMLKVDQPQAQAIAEICRLVQGLPLAVELVASHSRSLPPSDLVRMVRHHLRLGAAMIDKNSTMQRKEILWPVLDWCYRLLSPTLQVLFIRLGIFRGSWTLESAEAICAGIPDVPINVVEGLQTLVDKSLVQLETLPNGDHRYLMLDAVHAYAEGRLQRRREANHLQRLYSSYFTHLAESAEKPLLGADQPLWMARLQSDIYNLRSVLDWAVEQHPATALRIAGSLWLFWFTKGYAQEARVWIRQAWRREHEIEPVVRAKAAIAAGICAQYFADHADATLWYERGQALFKQVGDTFGETRALHNLSSLAYQQRYYQKAVELGEDVVARWQAMDDRSGEAAALSNLASSYTGLGRFDDAERCYQQSLQINRSLGNQVGIILCQSARGWLACAIDDLELAQEALEESLNLALQNDARNLIPGSQSALARVWYKKGQIQRAFELLRPVFDIQAQLQNLEQSGEEMITLAAILAEHYPKLAQQALEFAERMQDPYNQELQPDPATLLFFKQTAEQVSHFVGQAAATSTLPTISEFLDSVDQTVDPRVLG